MVVMVGAGVGVRGFFEVWFLGCVAVRAGLRVGNSTQGRNGIFLCGGLDRGGARDGWGGVFVLDRI